MRNPAWKRDELILALDLYFRLEYGQMDGKHPEVHKLSRLLTQFSEEVYERIVNSIPLKLANFKRFDPQYTGKGMKSGSKLDGAIWNEFVNDRNGLKREAEKIRTRIKHQTLISTSIENIPDEQKIRTEGGMKVFISKRVERNVKLRNQAIAIHGTCCMACDFDFGQKYGAWGEGFIEVHHLIPLSENKDYVRDTDPVKDLIVLCSNCHRMVHRKKNVVLSLDELIKKIQKPFAI